MKKIVSITLMLAMILALSVSAFAETPASQNMEVSYVVDSHYVIVIPDGGNDLIVDPDTGEGDMDIGVKVGTAKAAGTYTDTLTFSFRIVDVQ